MTSEVLLPWQTHTTCNFKYVCEMDANKATYKVKSKYRYIIPIVYSF